MLTSDGIVTFDYMDPLGGTSTIVIEESMFRVFVTQAKTLEELRLLCFMWPQRDLCNRKRQQKYVERMKAAAAGGR